MSNHLLCYFIKAFLSQIFNAPAAIEEKSPEMVVLKGTITVSDLAQALNSLGVAPRDVILIFQAIKEAGALHGQLIVM
jgi:flagellar P-ring protein FlgI